MRANPGKDKVREDCAGKDTSCPTYQQALAAQTRSNALLVTTGVLAVGTAVLGVWFTDWDHHDASPKSDEHTGTVGRIHPVVSLGSSHGFMVTAEGKF